MSAQRRQAYAICANRLPRGSALFSGRARLPALHCGLATGCDPDGSAPDPCFWDLAPAGVLPALRLSQSSALRADRS